MLPSGQVDLNALKSLVTSSYVQKAPGIAFRHKSGGLFSLQLLQQQCSVQQQYFLVPLLYSNDPSGQAPPTSEGPVSAMSGINA